MRWRVDGLHGRYGSEVRCPACESANVRDLGPLPQPPPTFGGAPFPQRPSPGHLWRCSGCHLRFRFPYLSQAELTALYEGLPNTVWSTSTDRPFWKNVRALCERYARGRTILDVGCFTGDFLSRMPPEWEKLGIEPAEAARKVAESRKIKIVAQSIGSAELVGCPPDVVTILDVLEHFENPFQVLAQSARLLGPGGCAIVLTGNANATPFRLLSNNYWYSFATRTRFFCVAAVV